MTRSPWDKEIRRLGKDFHIPNYVVEKIISEAMNEPKEYKRYEVAWKLLFEYM